MRETNYTEKLYKTIRKLNLDKEELKETLVCLYISGCSSEDCAKLFGTIEEKVVKFLQSEEIYEYKACAKCGKLRDREKDFRQRNNRKLTVCRVCEKEYDMKQKKEYYKNNIEKEKKHNKEYYANNKERLLKNSKEYHKNNKEEIKKQKEKYNEDNKERMKECKKNYYENNKEEILKNSKDYYKNNKERLLKNCKTYYENNKEKIQKCKKEYNQQDASVELVQKLATYEDVSENQIRCKYCGRWVTPTIIQVYSRLQGIEDDDKNYIYCSEECKQECPTYGQHKYPKGFKVASSREVNPVLRKIVLARDDYTCQKCGEYENVRLHCHHITPAVNSPMEADDPEICITFCKDCHKIVHKIPGCTYSELRCT